MVEGSEKDSISTKGLLKILAIVVGVSATIATVLTSINEQNLASQREAFEIRTGLRTEMVDAISKPLAIAQQLEQSIRSNAPHPIDFGESDNVMISNANLELLQNNKIVHEKLKTYFNDPNMIDKWDNLATVTYHFNGLTLLNNSAMRENKLNSPTGIWHLLQRAIGTEISGKYKDNFTTAEGENVTDSRINIDLIPWETTNLTMQLDENNTVEIEGTVDPTERLKHRELGQIFCQKFFDNNSTYCGRFYDGLYASAWNMIRDHILNSEGQLGAVVLNKPVMNLP